MSRLRTSFLATMLLNNVYAIAPVTLSGPEPALKESYAVNSHTIIQFTATNQVPQTSFPLILTGLTPPLSRVTVADDCGDSLAIGPSTCKIGIQIDPTAGMENQTISQVLSLNYEGRVALEQPISFKVEGATPPGNALLTAVGDSSRTPVLLTSTDNGETWVNTVFSETPGSGTFNATSCTGVVPNVICIAAGEDINFVAVTKDNGQTWSTSSLGTLEEPAFRGASCTGEGNEAVCVIAGNSLDATPGDETTLLYVSRDGGSTWQSKPSYSGKLFSVSCAGNGDTAFCAAVGSGGFLDPLLVYSNDGGNTWNKVSLSGVSTLMGVSCSFNENVPFCVAAGEKNSSPVIFLSSNNFSSWSEKNLNGPGSEASGLFATVSCAGSSTTAICSAGGINRSASVPLIAVSRDGGATWTIKNSQPAAISDGQYLSSTCTELAGDVTCAMIGNYLFHSPSALITVSNDGGTTWQMKSVPNVPDRTRYNDIFCKPNNQSGICTAVGVFDLVKFLIVRSSDAGATWEQSSQFPNLEGNLVSTSGVQ